MTAEAGDAAVGAPARASATPPLRAELVGRFPLARTLALFTLVFLGLAAPWLSGAVTTPRDAQAQFQPQLNFLAKSLAEGQPPLWTPHVFAG